MHHAFQYESIFTMDVLFAAWFRARPLLKENVGGIPQYNQQLFSFLMKKICQIKNQRHK
jgi:hypothetical protein